MMFILMQVIVIGIWGFFYQTAQEEQAKLCASNEINQHLFSETSNDILKKFGWQDMPKMLKNSNMANPKTDFLLTRGMLKGSFGLWPSNNRSVDGGQLPITDRFGSVTLTEALKQRAKLDQKLISDDLPLQSSRYGIKEWSFLISLMPLLTSIIGVLLVTVVIVD
ncbi:hypothetical protein [Lacticaseibacillus paracasei]|uniref:hypothetical protein n=1 Tax=Lacticaseibacillus paracasei TaxID=1597 RepID=UPI0021CE7731|nr:hypothetical protein [Lacticaseibacillus paracasei]MCU6431186.1 hypothetical protein [Lacticaseibacillus paracasei]